LDTSIRIATEADLPVILDMAMKFVENSNYLSYASKDKIERIVKSFIEADKTNSIIFLYEDKGMLVATSTPFIFGEDIKLATEIAWWVEPDARMSGIGKILLNAFEYWAEKIGCRMLSMSCLDDSVAKFYEKNGYKLYERTYFKEIK
jgi:N-acetylglutamate synthase-like GNAT family acetyltransferase